MDHVRLLNRITKVVFRSIPEAQDVERRTVALGFIESFEAEGANISGVADSVAAFEPELRAAYLAHRTACLEKLKKHIGVVTICTDGAPRRLTRLQEETIFFETQSGGKDVSSTYGQRVTVAPLFLGGEIEAE